jgi:hypothetical protein
MRNRVRLLRELARRTAAAADHICMRARQKQLFVLLVIVIG